MVDHRLTVLAFFCGNIGLSAHAGDRHTGPVVDSVVIGALAHNVHTGEAKGVDANLEIRFNLPLGLPEPIELLPTAGVTANFEGGANLGYLGATLRYQHPSGVYAEGFFGLAGHDADTPVSADEADLGCEAQFREAGEIGYRWQSHQIGAHVVHYSHGRILCDEGDNDGLTQVGVRYGYRF